MQKTRNAQPQESCSFDKVYGPETKKRTINVLLRDAFQDLRVSRELGWQLAKRDIKAQYRQAYLGLLWIILLPLANSLTWVFLSASRLVSIGPTEIPYPIYVFIGTMLWAVFIEALMCPIVQINNAKAMLTKQIFPREAVLLSGIYQLSINATTRVTLLAILLILTETKLSGAILAFPIALFSLCALGFSVGLILSPVGVLYSDIGKGIALVSQFAMYLAPVVVAYPQQGLAKAIFDWNPVTPSLVVARNSLTGQDVAMLPEMFIILFFTVATGLLAWLIFRMALPTLVERMSA